MRTQLTMHEIMRSCERPEYGAGPIFKYRVDGMPNGQEAFIVNVNVGRPRQALWKIDVGAMRTGNYKTAAEALAALQMEMDQVRNETTWYAVCPEGHVPLCELRPGEFVTCPLCDVPRKLTAVRRGFVSPEEKNKGAADSLPLKICTGPRASQIIGSPCNHGTLRVKPEDAGGQFSDDELVEMGFLLRRRNTRRPSLGRERCLTFRQDASQFRRLLNNPHLINLAVEEFCASTTFWKPQPSIIHASTQSLPRQRFHVVNWSSLSWCLPTGITSRS